MKHLKTTAIYEAICFHRDEIKRLKAMLPETPASAIMEACANVLGLHAELLFISYRNPKIMDFRRIVTMELARAGFSRPQIGDTMKRDQSTSTYHINKYRELYQYDPSFREMADACAKEVELIKATKNKAS